MGTNLPDSLNMDTLIEYWRQNGKNQVIVSFYQSNQPEDSRVFVGIFTPCGQIMESGATFTDIARRLTEPHLDEKIRGIVRWADESDIRNISKL